jgi:hypothetical protein
MRFTLVPGSFSGGLAELQRRRRDWRKAFSTVTYTCLGTSHLDRVNLNTRVKIGSMGLLATDNAAI